MTICNAGTEITASKEDTQSKEEHQLPNPVKQEVDTVAQKVAQVNIGITPADNPQKVSYTTATTGTRCVKSLITPLIAKSFITPFH